MKKVVQDLTSGGIDWQREKWQSGLGSKFIHQGEKNAAKYADEVIVLSKGVQDYFKETYGREAHFIPNGVNRPQTREASLIKTPDGCKIGAPQKVIYQCSEDGVSDTIKPRLERYGADCRKIAFINEEVYNGLTLDDERIRQAIIEFRPRLVVIDPIQAYLGSDSDLQIAGRARKLMHRLGMWAAGYDCAIVLIGHLNKKEGSKGLYRSLGSIDVVAAARSVLQVERDTENPDIRIVHQIKNSLAPTAEDIRFSISADKGFRWLECRPQSFENQKPDRKPEFESEQQKAVYWIKHFLEKGDMSANEIYCRLDNEGVSKRVARMVKTEMGIHCYQKKRRWYWSVQPEEGAVNGPQV